jgi:type IV pilus assembly protein PilA
MRRFLKKLERNEGFSLVELMIVVAIIGILAGLAVPKFQMFQAKAKQSEAKNNLSHIYTLEMSYFGDNDAYATWANAIGRIGPGNAPADCNHTTATNAIGFKPQGNCSKVRYGYTVSSTNMAENFTATAASQVNLVVSGCPSVVDTWDINQNKEICSTPGNCRDATKLCK